MPEADANPEKKFFIDLITRDISLEDAILDLIDNSVDSLRRTREIDLYKNVIQPANTPAEPLAEIRISFTPKQFKIADNCGGYHSKVLKKMFSALVFPIRIEGNLLVFLALV